MQLAPDHSDAGLALILLPAEHWDHLTVATSLLFTTHNVVNAVLSFASLDA